jgi:ribose 1,5-bisphosphokinase PhnN
MADQPLSLNLPPGTLAPLVRSIVTEVLAQAEADRQHLDGTRLCYTEEEVAALLQVEPHVLRDERRRGRISASSIVGRRIRYTPADLIGYLASRRIGAEEE